MTKVNVSYTDFSAGELSPKMSARFDLAVFYSGHARVENFEIESVGQASFRQGYSYAATTAGNNPAFLYTWKYSDNLSFVLEFTNLKLRFFRNNGRVTENAQSITNVTQANPAVVTYTGDDNYSNGDSIVINYVAGMTELNGEEFTVANVNTASNTFELASTDSTGFSAYTSGGEVAVITEVVTPYTTDQLQELKFAQNGVDMYITHPEHQPRKLTYISPINWTNTTHAPTGLVLSAGKYPSAVTFFEQRLVYGGAYDYPQTLFFSKSANPNNFTVGTGVDDGMQYSVSGDGNSIKWLRGTSKFLAVGTFGDVLEATGGLDGIITPSSISIRPSNGYGVANINPLGKNNQIFYMQNDNLILRSFEFKFEVDSYIPVDRTVIAEHITRSGINKITFQEGRPNILWAVRNDGILSGMTIEESEGVSGWQRQATKGKFISATSQPRANQNMQLWVCVKRTINGVDKYYIEYKNDPVLFPYRSDYVTGDQDGDEKRFRNVMFEAQKQYIYLDSSLTYDGLNRGINAGASVSPSAVSGSGITMTASDDVFSASDIGREIWRKSITGDETGRAVITGFTSATVVTCDVLEHFDSTESIPSGEWYITTDSVIGIDHLEGESVSITADGGQHQKKTVTNGIVTLDRQVSVCHIGLGYTGWIETNSIEGGGTNGTSQTKKKSISSVGVRFLNTMFGRVGTSYYDLTTIHERTSAMAMDRPPIPFTGDKKINTSSHPNDPYDGGWSREKKVIISQDQPFPCNVQLIIPYLSVSN